MPYTVQRRPGVAGYDLPWWKTAANTVLSLFDAGSNPRSGGADPCCPPGYDPAFPWPTNSSVGGAPPDYRTRGSPMEDPSPSGQGRKKDDFCDCIPISVGGKYYMVGGINQDGGVTVGLPADRDNAVWVQVDRNTLKPLAVPGVNVVTAQGGGGTPGTPRVEPNLPDTTMPAMGSVGTLLGIGLALAAARHFRWI